MTQPFPKDKKTTTGVTDLLSYPGFRGRKKIKQKTNANSKLLKMWRNWMKPYERVAAPGALADGPWVIPPLSTPRHTQTSPQYRWRARGHRGLLTSLRLCCRGKCRSEINSLCGVWKASSKHIIIMLYSKTGAAEQEMRCWRHKSSCFFVLAHSEQGGWAELSFPLQLRGANTSVGSWVWSLQCCSASPRLELSSKHWHLAATVRCRHGCS